MILTGTDHEHSVEDYFNAVIANLFSILWPEPIDTPFYHSRIFRRTSIMQTTLDGAVQKRCSFLPIEIKSNRKGLFKKLQNHNRFKNKQATSRNFM